MTEKLNTLVRIPVWLITLFVPLFISFLIFSSTQIRAQQRTNTKVEILERDMNKKADQTEIRWIKESIDKMDSKLDRLIENQ